MVLGVALRDVLYQGAVVRHEVARNVDGFSVPNLTVLQIVLLRVQCRQEPQLSPDAEVGDDDVERFVEELIFADFGHQIIPNRLLGRYSALDARVLHGCVLARVGAIHHRLRGLRVGKLVEAERL